MTEEKREQNARGDYIDTWPHHQEGVLIYASHECIVRIDKAGKLDWETTQQYDAEVATRPGFNAKLRTTVLNDAALLEVTPCEGVSNEAHERFKRLIGEALRCCIALDYSSAQKMLSAARLFIQARVEETSRSWYLSASFLASMPFLAAGLIIWTFRDFYRTLLGADAVWLVLASVAGSLGALLSVIVRTGRLKFDCSAGKKLHYLEGGSRIAAGAISGVLVALAIKSEIVFAVLAQGNKLHLVMMLGALVGGAGERLATSIISKFDASHVSGANGKGNNVKEDKSE